MATSKLYHQLSSTLFLLQKRKANFKINKISRLPSLSSSSSPSLFPKSFSRRFYSSFHGSAMVSADDDVDAPLSSSSFPSISAHPWPEWDQFVQKMRMKGYFEIPNEENGVGDNSSYSMEVNRVKNACLKFARERYDIIRSLPKQDIQAIVECGCPNIFRKAVNSAKRLRAFLRLDEGDVCSSCSLRGSCDRAYVIETDDDKARTVDVMRILMSYAINPALQPGGTNPSITEHVQECARKLLGELIKLSDTTIDPSLPKPEVQLQRKKESTEKSQNVASKSKRSQNVEMKKGDWLCSDCNFLNFARNIRCLECKAEGPMRVDFRKQEMKLGDWTCPTCESMNFARNRKCFRCQEWRPKRELNPGEWECPKCDFLNFRKNMACKKCKCERPATLDAEDGFGDHAWENPRTAKENKFLNFGNDEDENEQDDGDEFDDIRTLKERTIWKGANGRNQLRGG